MGGPFSTRHVGGAMAGRVHGCAYIFAWMLWIPAVVSGQAEDAPPEAEAASEAPSESAGAESAGAESAGAESAAAESDGAESAGAESAGAESAGAESGAAVAAATEPHASPGDTARHELRLWAHAPGVEGLALLIRPGRTREAWRLVCELPCEVTAVPGAWDIAVRLPGAEHPLPVAERTIELHADGSLELRYSSREWIRIVGALALCIGVAGGIASAVGLLDEIREPESLGRSLVQALSGLGLVLSGALTLVGMGLLAFTPIARVRWVP